MYDLLVFSNGPGAYAPKRIMEECVKSGLKCAVIGYRSIRLNFSEDSLPETRGLFIRGMGEDVNHLPLKYFILNYYLGKAKIVNSNSFSKWLSLDKITQHVEFEKNQIPFVKSYYFGSRDLALSSLESFKFPMIAKYNAGSKGMSVYKINSTQELERILDEKHDIRTMLFQDFVEGGEDLRVIVLNGKILGAMKRVAKDGEYLTNYSQGGNVFTYDIEKDEEAKSIALKVANTFGLDYCGVDLMKSSTGEWLVLEVNRACQFQGFEKSTGVNVAREIVKYVTS